MPASIYSIVIESPYQQEDMLTETTEVILGRAEEVGGEFLRIVDPGVSRQQARLVFTGEDRVRIINLGTAIRFSSGYVLKQETEGEFFLPVSLSIGETTIVFPALSKSNRISPARSSAGCSRSRPATRRRPSRSGMTTTGG